MADEAAEDVVNTAFDGQEGGEVDEERGPRRSCDRGPETARIIASRSGRGARLHRCTALAV